MNLTTIEWLTIVTILTVVVLIGLWNAKRGHMTGKTKASLLELSISTIVTFSSSVAMMGVPGETFNIGFRYGLIVISYPIFTLVLSTWFVEAYRKKEILSIFDFIRLRFDERTKQLALFIYILQSSIYLSVSIYAPALALSTFISIKMEILLLIMFLITIFVSSVGGIKAVLTTDVFFGVVIFVSQLGILIHSISQIGSESAHDNLHDAYANFTLAYHESYSQTFKLSVYEKYGFWDLTIGVCFMCTYLYGANHAGVIRILSAKSDRAARQALWINFAGLTLILFIGLGFGFVVKLHYWTLPRNTKTDQLLITYIIEKYAEFPFLRGLFIGAVLSAALSTASSIIISITDCVCYDLLSFSGMGNKLERKVGNGFPRLISIASGIICYGMALLVSKLGRTVISIAFANFGICGGPFLGLCIAGIQTRFYIPAKVAYRSTLVSLILTAIGGFGGAFGLESLRISPLWWTPFGCLINLALCLTSILFLPSIDRQNIIASTERNQKLEDELLPMKS